MKRAKGGRYILRKVELVALMEASQKAVQNQLRNPAYNPNHNPLPCYVSWAYELLHGKPLYSEDVLAGSWAVDTHGELIEDPGLYDKLKVLMGGVCIDLHAIYDKGSDSNYPEFYCAVLDLFRSGITYKVFFSLDDNSQICVEDLFRWWFG